MEDVSFVPQTIAHEDVTPGNLAELTPLINFLYSKLHVVITREQAGDVAEEFRIELRYFNLTDNQINQSLAQLQVIPELRPDKTLGGLYKMIMRTLNPGFPMTRQHIRSDLTIAE